MGSRRCRTPHKQTYSINSNHRLDSLLELIFSSSRNIKQNASSLTGPIASFDQTGVRGNFVIIHNLLVLILNAT